MTPDRSYNNFDYIPDGEAYPDRWLDAATAHREREAAIGRARLNMPYGSHEREKMDIFYPAGKPEGLMIFIHGGYWLRFDRGYFSHLSQGAVARGFAVAMPSYPLAPEARIHQIARSVAASLPVASALVPGGPIWLVGHSAGGHLAARMACADMVIDASVRARLRHVLTISPLSDLRPLLELTMNDVLRLDAAEAEAESPRLHTPLDVPLTIWVGAEERPVFLDHARWLSEAWGRPLRIAPGRHHLDIIDDLVDPVSPISNALFGAVADTG